jgi:hypothetical protein
MLIALVLFDVVPSALWFGPRAAIKEHQAWLQRAQWHSSLKQIEQPLWWAHRHRSNFSYASVLTRWLREAPASDYQVIIRGDAPPGVIADVSASLQQDEMLVLEPMPPRDGEPWTVKRVDVSWAPRLSVAALSAGAVKAIWLTTVIAGLLALTWFTWRLPRGSNAWPAVVAVWILATFWISPMARHYYLAWALPALGVVSHALALVWPGMDRWRRGVAIGIGALGCWWTGVFLLGEPVSRWYGVHLAALAALLVATL